MHEDSLLHTDIKPNNILVTTDSKIKIIDFGQSCPIGFRKPRIQGTPDYIAPEQVERRHLTQQTDVFNLGATLYWALTGQTYPTMITKKGRQQDAATRRKRVPTPQELNPEIPSALSKLVMESCSHERSMRPRDMKEVIARLEMLHHVLAKRREAGHDMSTTIRPPEPGGVAAETLPADFPPDSDDSYDFSGFIREVVQDESDSDRRKEGGDK
jgi:serine/threonine-protein kinase